MSDHNLVNLTQLLENLTVPARTSEQIGRRAAGQEKSRETCLQRLEYYLTDTLHQSLGVMFVSSSPDIKRVAIG